MVGNRTRRSPTSVLVGRTVIGKLDGGYEGFEALVSCA